MHAHMDSRTSGAKAGGTRVQVILEFKTSLKLQKVWQAYPQVTREAPLPPVIQQQHRGSYTSTSPTFLSSLEKHMANS